MLKCRPQPSPDVNCSNCTQIQAKSPRPSSFPGPRALVVFAHVMERAHSARLLGSRCAFIWSYHHASTTPNFRIRLPKAWERGYLLVMPLYYIDPGVTRLRMEHIGGKTAL